VELALARGKKLYDKREDQKRKIAERETLAALKMRK
jgi:tmRNA-binding protein